MSESLIERVARAIATDMGDDLAAIPQNKRDWIDTRGKGRGEYSRDINMPKAADYRSAARAAIAAMRDLPEPIIDAALAATAARLNIPGSAATVNREKMRRRHRAAMDAILKEPPRA